MMTEEKIKQLAKDIALRLGGRGLYLFDYDHHEEPEGIAADTIEEMLLEALTQSDTPSN